MLKVYYGTLDEALYGPAWFLNNYEQSWFEDPFVQAMVADVDKTEYKEGEVFESSVLGAIPPERLSGGVKTLISIYKNPDLIFDATSCGDNCAKWLLEIGKVADIKVTLRYAMRFPENDAFEISLENNKTIYTNRREYTLAALSVIDEEL